MILQSVSDLSPLTLGQYFIDRLANVHVNWESPLGKETYDSLEAQITKPHCTDSICSSRSSNDYMRISKWTLSRSHPYHIRLAFVVGERLPVRVVPKDDYTILNTYIGNGNEVMQCGFLANPKYDGGDSVKLQVRWFRDNL